jgi:hypothetical protein
MVFAQPGARARCNRSDVNEGRAAAADGGAKNSDFREMMASALAMLVDRRSVVCCTV